MSDSMRTSVVPLVLTVVAFTHGTLGQVAVADEADQAAQGLLDRLSSVLREHGRQRVIVGAQVAVGTSKGECLTQSLGATAPGGRRPVDDDTQFCIGSCSKPFAAVCLVAAAQDGQIDLDTPIEKWVPAAARLVSAGGHPVERSPTLRELLAHRGGIYSQKAGPMTPDQNRAIRDFRLTLSESVSMILKQPLIAAPGETYAYSGAGYCLAGFAAEKATGTSFEELLQATIVRPLGLSRTTYFPAARDTNIAVPGMKGTGGKIVRHTGAPHLLSAQLRLPLIGGSLYSTAAETATFARMILNKGRLAEQSILSEASWRELARQQFAGQGYGLGWGMTIRNSEVTAMRHTGALLGYRSLLVVDFASDRYAVVHWTLADAQDPRGDRLRTELEGIAFSE